jgi:hypothetical protein
MYRRSAGYGGPAFTVLGQSLRPLNAAPGGDAAKHARYHDCIAVQPYYPAPRPVVVRDKAPPLGARVQRRRKVQTTLQAQKRTPVPSPNTARCSSHLKDSHLPRHILLHGCVITTAHNNRSDRHLRTSRWPDKRRQITLVADADTCCCRHGNCRDLPDNLNPQPTGMPPPHCSSTATRPDPTSFGMRPSTVRGQGYGTSWLSLGPGPRLHV